MVERLSGVAEEYIRNGVETGVHIRPDYVATLLAELDAVRTEREDARRWAVRYEQMMHAERAAAYDLLLAATSGKPIFSPPADIVRDAPEPELVLVLVEIDNWNVSSNEDGPYGSVDAEIKVIGGDGLAALVKLLEAEPEKLHIVGRK